MNEFLVGDEVSIENGGYYGHIGTIVRRMDSRLEKWMYRVYIPAADNTFTYYEKDLSLVRRKDEKEMAEIKDSGERTEFESGAVRDMSEGKGSMIALPWAALLRLSIHYENGAKKYGMFNYQKGIPVSSFLDSALRHLAKYQAGWDDEDHLAAAAFNILGALQMEETKPEMNDLEIRKGTMDFTYKKPQKDDLQRLVESITL